MKQPNQSATRGSKIVGVDLQFSNSPKAATLLATASMAWILAVAAAAATAAAVGRTLDPVEGPKRALGGVMARPTLERPFNYKNTDRILISYRKYCPPKSKRFMLAIASFAACAVSYSIKP